MTVTDETTKVVETASVGIRARYYGPTNTRGSRIRAWRADDSSPTLDPMAITHHWDYALSSGENFRAAVEMYLQAHIDAGHGWEGTWVLGAGRDEYMAVRIPRELAR